jgi:uncharacterized membrane protein
MGYSLGSMLIVSGIIFTIYGIFSFFTSWNTDSFAWSTVLIIIIGIILLPIGTLVKKQQIRKDSTLEILKRRHANGEISDEEFNIEFRKFS